MRRFILAIAMMATISPAFADTPQAVITGPSQSTPGSTLVLDARKSVSDKPLRWRVEPESTVFLTLDQDDKKGVIGLILSAPPGVYRFVLIARGTPPGAAELDADATVHIVTVADPTPPPVPPVPDPPSPGPGPAPIPPGPTPVVAGHMFATLIVDASNLTPTDSAIRTSTAIRQTLPTFDTTWRTYRSDESEPAKNNLISYATATGYPCLIIQTADGKVHASSKITSETQVIATVKGLRGQP